MKQFFADHIDQMDLALDQLALRDRNFDRFAIMLIDNLVEVTLHQYAEDQKAKSNTGWSNKAATDPKIEAALGPRFDAKLQLAQSTGLISNDICESIRCLHVFRNTAYHRGLRHEGILHSLALFYFKNACTVLEGYSPLFWSSSSRDQISHRAMKYLGNIDFFNPREAFMSA